MRYLSVCSGIEAATVAWHHMGWEPAAFSEIEKFPSEVLAHHYPNVPNVGDMTKFEEWNLGTVELLVGGTPCQSFSVAGLRKGLDDPRGNLMLTYLAIARKHRPKWLVWENVPGVLSSNGGEDFATLLRGLVELGYGWAYRIFDAQYFGVAQRRRRVFVVGYLGTWHPAAAVLFERQSLRGDPAPSRKEKQESSSDTGQSPYGDGIPTVAQTLSSRDYKGPSCGRDGVVGNPIPVTVNQNSSVFEYHPADSRVKEMGEVCQTMTSRWGTGGGNVPVTLQPNMAVRKLTPVECERLQGFPDNYTNIREKCPDGPRYKALGNSMAVPVMRWIGERIRQVDEL